MDKEESDYVLQQIRDFVAQRTQAKPKESKLKRLVCGWSPFYARK